MRSQLDEWPSIQCINDSVQNQLPLDSPLQRLLYPNIRSSRPSASHRATTGRLHLHRITCNRARAIDPINPGSSWLIAHLIRPGQRITLNHPEVIKQSLCVFGCPLKIKPGIVERAISDSVRSDCKSVLLSTVLFLALIVVGYDPGPDTAYSDRVLCGFVALKLCG